MFETNGLLDEKAYREIGRRLLAPWVHAFYFAAAALYLLLAVWFLIRWSFGMAALCLLLAVLMILLDILMPRRTARTALRRMRESGAVEIRYRTRFDDEGIYIENQTTGASGTIGYPAFKKIFRTAHILVLVTKARQAVFVFRDSLGADGERELIAFLRQKPTAIRRWPN